MSMTIQERRRMYSVLKMQERREKGLCTHCGKSAPLEGHRLCEKCLLIMTVNNRERYDRLTAEGICYICGKRPVAPGKRGCEECRARISERRRLKKEEGLCLNCGKKHEGGTTYCFECRVKMSEAERRRNGGK